MREVLCGCINRYTKSKMLDICINCYDDKGMPYFEPLPEPDSATSTPRALPAPKAKVEVLSPKALMAEIPQTSCLSGVGGDVRRPQEPSKYNTHYKFI